MIILICLVIFLIIDAWFAIKLLNKELDSRLYRCKLKCPSTGEWFDAITYKGVEDKFVKLNDWKNGNKDK